MFTIKTELPDECHSVNDSLNKTLEIASIKVEPKESQEWQNQLVICATKNTLSQRDSTKMHLNWGKKNEHNARNRRQQVNSVAFSSDLDVHDVGIKRQRQIPQKCMGRRCEQQKQVKVQGISRCPGCSPSDEDGSSSLKLFSKKGNIVLNERISQLCMKRTSGVGGGLTEKEQKELNSLLGQLEESGQEDCNSITKSDSFKPWHRWAGHQSSYEEKPWNRLNKHLQNSNWYSSYQASVIRCRYILCPWLFRCQDNSIRNVFHFKSKHFNGLNVAMRRRLLARAKCVKWIYYAKKLRKSVVMPKASCTCWNALEWMSLIDQDITVKKEYPNIKLESYQQELFQQSSDEIHTRKKKNKKDECLSDPDWHPEQEGHTLSAVMRSVKSVHCQADADKREWNRIRMKMYRARKKAKGQALTELVHTGKIVAMTVEEYATLQKLENVKKMACNKSKQGKGENNELTGNSSTADALVPEQNKVKKRKKIPRPMNAFMLFSKEHRRNLLETHDHNNQAVSITLGDMWASLTPDEKDKYYKLSKEEEKKHKLRHPEYWEDPPLKPRTTVSTVSWSTHTTRKKSMIASEPLLSHSQCITNNIQEANVHTVVLPPGMMLKPVPGGFSVQPVENVLSNNRCITVGQVNKPNGTPESKTNIPPSGISDKPICYVQKNSPAVTAPELPAGVIQVEPLTEIIRPVTSSQELPSGIVSVQTLSDFTSAANVLDHIKCEIKQEHSTALPPGITNVTVSNTHKCSPESIIMPGVMQVKVLEDSLCKSKVLEASQHPTPTATDQIVIIDDDDDDDLCNKDVDSDEVHRPLTPTRFTRLMMENIGGQCYTVKESATLPMQSAYNETKQSVHEDNEDSGNTLYVGLQKLGYTSINQSPADAQVVCSLEQALERKRERDRERMREWRKRKRQEKWSDNYMDASHGPRKNELARKEMQQSDQNKISEEKNQTIVLSPTLIHEGLLAQGNLTLQNIITVKEEKDILVNKS